MRRRDFVRSVGAACSVGVAGCLHNGGNGGSDGDDSNGGNGGSDGESEREAGILWSHEVTSQVDGTADGNVYGREDWADEDGVGGVFGLAGDTVIEGGWTYGEAGGYSTYTRVVVRDGAFDRGLYFGSADDAIGSGDGELYALELDGTERWVRDVGSVYDAPVVKNETVYAGTDRGEVYAFDVNGDELWRYDDISDYGVPANPSVEAVDDDVVYVTFGGLLAALDAEDGDELWQHADMDVSTAAVDDGVVYITRTGGVSAYSEDEELWSHDVEGTNSWIRGVAHGNVYFRHSFDLRAVDMDNGNEAWRVEMDDHFETGFGDETVYVGADILRAVSSDGDDEWDAELDGTPLSGVTVGDEEIYAVTERSVYRLDGEDGDILSSVELPGAERSRSHALGDNNRVYVGTDSGLHSVQT